MALTNKKCVFLIVSKLRNSSENKNHFSWLSTVIWARGLHRNHGEWGSARYCRGWHWSIANVNQVLAKIYDWYRYSIAAGDGGGGLCVCNLYVHTFSLFEPSTQISPPINCFGWSWILDMDIAAKKCKMHFSCQKKLPYPIRKIAGSLSNR